MEPSPFVVPLQRPMESSQNLFKSDDISWGFNYFFFERRDPYEITEVRPPATEESVVEAASVIAGQLQRILDFDQFQNDVKKKLSQLEKRIDRKYQLPNLFMWKSVWFYLRGRWSSYFISSCNHRLRGETMKLNDIAKVQATLRQLQDTIAENKSIDFSRLR